MSDSEKKHTQNRRAALKRLAAAAGLTATAPFLARCGDSSGGTCGTKAYYSYNTLYRSSKYYTYYSCSKPKETSDGG